MKLAFALENSIFRIINKYEKPTYCHLIQLHVHPMAVDSSSACDPSFSSKQQQVSQLPKQMKANN